MLSAAATTTSSRLLSSTFLPSTCPPKFHHSPAISHKPHHNNNSFTVSAIIMPGSSSSSSKPSKQLYQPFRPPPSPLPPKFRDLDTAGRIEVLANRLGLWFEYAPLISALIQEGFSPPNIEELTGISGVEQNRLVVGAKVRETLIQSDADPDILAFFDTGGAELLYEIRLLSASQRALTAKFLVENRMDSKGAQDVAKAIKDFPSRRGDKGWEKFDYTFPGDCLAFMYYRQSREHKNPSPDRTAALEQALAVAVTDKAKGEILEELEGGREDSEVEEEAGDGIRVPVVRMKIGEVAEASSVVVLPVCRAEEKEREVLEAPWKCDSIGEFGVVVADKGWNRWVVLPGWEPIVGLGNGGVVVSFPNARILPWNVNRSYNDEAILVVADRARKEVKADDGFYLVAVDSGGDGSGGGLKVEKGLALKENGLTESLGVVLLVVRPPRYDNDAEWSDEEWD